MKNRGCTLCLAILLLAVLPAVAQRITASLGGTVTDPSGAAVPAATVRITNTGTANVFQAATDAAGRFLVPSLTPGQYDLSVDVKSFKRTERKGLTLNVGQSVELDFTLELGSATETVQVTGEAPLMETTSGQLGQVINNQSIVNLPLNQRNPFSLILLAPGVSGTVTNEFRALQINVNGGRSGTTDVLLDGVPSAPPTDSFNTVGIFPSVDAVQEFKVQTSSYSAEFGLSGGGVINVVYKSGANAAHGSAYEFLRNSVLDANNFFSNRLGAPLTSFKRSQFGASLGGPVILPKLYDGRNKTFFFVDYEGLRQRSAATTLSTVPTAAERNGDFSQIRTSAGAAINIYDPLSTTLVGSTYTRQPFPGNVIPAGRFDTVAANVRKYWPAPNSPGAGGGQNNNFYAASAAPYNIDQYDVKVDQTISDRQRLSVRFSKRNPASQPAIFFPQDLVIAQNAATNRQNATSGALNYSFAVTPSYLIEFRYGINRVLYKVETISDNFDPTQLGFPTYIRDTANALAFPGFTPAGYMGLGTGSQLAQGILGMVGNSWALANTKSLSRHTLKFGAEVRALANNTNQMGRSTGDYNFATSFTQGPNAQASSATAGDGFASFLLGLGAGTLTHNFKIIDTVSQYAAAYIQDDWKIASKLTLNLGLRYDFYIPRVERHDRQVYLDLTAPSPLAGPSGLATLKGGLAYAGVNGNPRSQFDMEKRDFGPRFGFAYQPAKRAVIRGGYGIFYSVSPTEAAATVGATGFRSDTSFQGTVDGVTPYNYLRNPFPNSSFVPVTGSSLGLATATGTGISAPLRHTPTPYSQNFNLGIQYQLPGEWLLEAAYGGSRGVNLISPSNTGFNQLPVSAMSLGSQLLTTVKNPFYGVITNAGALSGTTVQTRYLMAPYPQFTGVGWGYQPGASSVYHSLQLRAEKRLTHDLGLLVAFTGAKMMDDASSNNTGNFNGNGTSQDFNNRHDDWSISTADVSSRFVGSVVYSLPFGRKKQFGSGWNRFTDALLGGWQTNAILTLQTGQPLALSASNVANIFNPGERPNNNGHSAALSGRVEDRLNRYFDTSVFSQPSPYTLGNVARTLPDVRNPSTRNIDLSLFKSFTVTEKLRIEYRAEAFNAFNTPVFSGPNGAVNSSAFGVISAQANSPRQVQMALKLLF
jgi:hypothetical protein